jgi:sugar O-acyltransferase (sialic acid O-acetyltransferase NeuD family)
LFERTSVTSPLFFLGNGGYSREVALIADVVDVDRRRWSSHVFLGPDDEEAALRDGGEVALAVGTAAVRLRLWDKYCSRSDLSWPTLVHPRADIGPTVELGTGVCFSSGSIATANIVIGDGALVNLNVTIGHDSRIGRCCVLNPGVAISGGVVLGDGCLIGAGAVILEHVEVGPGSTVGAGSVVTRNVPEGSTVVGVPAKPLVKAEPLK